ncbi:MAG: hypothetical protein ACO1RT_03555 [Planctomycetaceae bacterium]
MLKFIRPLLTSPSDSGAIAFGVVLMLLFPAVSIGADPAAVSATAAASATPDPAATTSATQDDQPETDDPAVEVPWDYDPYRVQIWIASNDQRASAQNLSSPILEYLDRPFAAVWRASIAEAPAAVRAGAMRDFAAMNYGSITSADSVLAVKRDHPEAVRIRTASDVAKYVKSCITTADRLAEVKRRGAAIGNPTLDGVDRILTAAGGDPVAVSASWSDPKIEAVLLSRGMAAQLRSPEAKIIRMPLDESVAEDIQAHDKVFVVRVQCDTVPMQVEVVEIDCLMRHFSPVITSQALNFASLPAVIGQAIIDAFAPVVRIEDAGQKSAVGLVRAAKLVTEDHHPALISTGEFLQPMVRKDDRNGNPIAIGPISWAYLHVTKAETARVEMTLYSGQSGGIQGRKNKRTFRVALRTRPVADSSIIRLHAQGARDEPLVGYEVYEKQLDSIDMKLVGRTDWDGRITIHKSDAAMRLLYVKNGGAVLARLPIVPGLIPMEVADLTGDDQRLRAEAYIRGTQNAIIDLIAIRQLLAARIRLRLEKGQLAEAKELVLALRSQPTYDTIANDMDKKVTQIKGRNNNEQRKIDLMFSQTREMLRTNINPKLLRDLEADVATAEANGGVLKPQAAAKDGQTPTPPATPAKAQAPPKAATPQPAAPQAATPEPAAPQASSS